MLHQLDDQAIRPAGAPGIDFEAVCERTAARFGVGRRELAGASLRREVLAARAVVSDLAVRHYGLSLNALARHLSLSRQSIARALERAASVYREHGCEPADFLVGR